jgi:hypothetical protein
VGPEYIYLYLTAMRDEAMTATFAYARIEERVHRLRELREATAHLFTDEGDFDEELARALNNEEFYEMEDVEEDLAAAIEAFLSAQTRLSLFIAPSPGARERARANTRAAVLCTRLGLKKGDDLGDRGLRNAWMHIDESLDAFLFERAESADLVVRHVGTAAKSERNRVLRLIDPSGLKVWLLGQEYSLLEIHEWVNDIDRRLGIALQEVEAELDNRRRERRDPDTRAT